jgi:hypothetical protein|tara:strand:+ start:112 stop:897 length:786 start_codon:yes stop_codon:yes gene_type:complete
MKKEDQQVMVITSFKTTILLGIYLSIFGQIEAQIITDRPDQTESSYSVGNGNLQLETGVLISFDGETQNSNRQILAPTNLFRYGVSKGIEVRVLSQYEIVDNENISTTGMSDLEVGTKIQLFNEEDKNTAIAFLSHLIIPSGSKELTNDKFGTINKLSISHVINDHVAVGYNVGYNYFGLERGDLTYSLALGISVNDQVGIYIEPYGEIVNFENPVCNFDAGLTFLANENFQYDFSFGTGINNTMNYMSIGFSWLVNKDVK